MRIVLLFLLITGMTACSKKSISESKRLTGKWRLSEVYANEHWGGAFAWKPISSNTEIEFKKNGTYYRKNNTDARLVLIGQFRLMADNKIKITPDNTTLPTYTLDYSFEPDGQLVWGILATEGTIKEKFRRIQ